MLNPEDNAENLEQHLVAVYCRPQFADLNGIVNLGSQEGSPSADHLYDCEARLVIDHTGILDTAA